MQLEAIGKGAVGAADLFWSDDPFRQGPIGDLCLRQERQAVKADRDRPRQLHH
jgi:hypothetical protein